MTEGDRKLSLHDAAKKIAGQRAAELLPKLAAAADAITLFVERDAIRRKRSDATERLDDHARCARSLARDLREPWFLTLIQGGAHVDADIEDLAAKLDDLAARAIAQRNGQRPGGGSDKVVPMRNGKLGDYLDAPTLAALVVSEAWQLFSLKPFTPNGTSEASAAHSLLLAAGGEDRVGSWRRTFESAIAARAQPIDEAGSKMDGRWARLVHELITSRT